MGLAIMSANHAKRVANGIYAGTLERAYLHDVERVSHATSLPILSLGCCDGLPKLTPVFRERQL